MAKLWAIIRREYLERVRTRWFLVSTVFGPILFGLLLFLPPWLADRNKASVDIGRIAIVDATGTNLGKRIAAELNGGIAGDTTRARVIAVSAEGARRAEDAAVRDVRATGSKGVLVLDAGTLAGVRARYVGTNATSTFDMAELRRVVRNEVLEFRLERAGIDAFQASALASARLDVDAVRLTEEGGRAGSSNVNITFAFAVAFLLYISIFIYGQNVLRGVMEEKQTRVAEVVVASVSATKLLAGKVLGVGAVGLTQMLAWLGASYVLTQARGAVLGWFGVSEVPLELPHISAGVLALLVAYFLLGYIFYSSLFAAVGAVVSSEQEAQQAQLPVALLLVGSAIFIQPILLSPDGALAETMSWIPFSAPIAMPLRLATTYIPPAKIAFSLMSLTVGCYLAVLIAARVYRVGLLMYGKRPTIGEIFRWVRFAR